MTEYLIEVRNLTRRFGPRKARVTAVDDVSFGIRKGEVVCLVGESGCGKTTTGKMIAGLLKPTEGQVLYEGKPVWVNGNKKGEDFKTFRMGVQIIHQDPYASLNPSHTVFKMLSTPLLHHKLVANRNEARDTLQPEAGIRRHLPLYHPRPGRRQGLRVGGAHRRDVRGQHRRICVHTAVDQRPTTPLQQSPTVGGTGTRPRTHPSQGTVFASQSGYSQFAGPPQWMPISSALPPLRKGAMRCKTSRIKTNRG